MKDHIHSEVKDQLLNHLNDKKSDPDYDYIPPVPPITLSNGVVMSVQASKTHYCHPRIDYGIWDSVEVYIDSKYYKKICDELLKYNETEGDCRVMGYVPIDLVVAVIITSGGICSLSEISNDDHKKSKSEKSLALRATETMAELLLLGAEAKKTLNDRLLIP